MIINIGCCPIFCITLFSPRLNISLAAPPATLRPIHKAETWLLCKLMGSFCIWRTHWNAWSVATSEEDNNNNNKSKIEARQSRNPLRALVKHDYHSSTFWWQLPGNVARFPLLRRMFQLWANQKKKNLVIELSSFVFYKCYHKYSILLITTHNSSQKYTKTKKRTRKKLASRECATRTYSICIYFISHSNRNSIFFTI